MDRHVHVELTDPGEPGRRSGLRPVAAVVVAAGLMAVAPTGFVAAAGGTTGGTAGVAVSEAPVHRLRVLDVSPSGEFGNEDGYPGAVTPDGRYVVFQSEAGNLTDRSFRYIGALYRRDRVTGRTVKVSEAPNGNGITVNDGAVAMSPDGRFIAFTSPHGPEPDKPTGWTEVYVRDMQSRSVVRASVPAGGGWSRGNSSGPSISADGTVVSFLNSAAGMVPDADGQRQHVYVRNLRTGTTVAADRLPDGSLAGLGSATGQALSADGTRIVYSVSNRTGSRQAHLRVLPTGEDRVLVGPGTSRPYAISGDGRFVLLSSSESFDGHQAGPGGSALYRRDTVTGKTIWVNKTPAGSGLECRAPSGERMSGSGRQVVYNCELPPRSSNKTVGVVHDLVSGVARRLDRDRTGTPVCCIGVAGVTDDGGALLGASDPALTGDPRYYDHVLFRS